MNQSDHKPRLVAEMRYMSPDFTMAENSVMSAAVEHLDNPASTIILHGLSECLRFTTNPLLELLGTAPAKKEIEKLQDMFEDKQLLVPYHAFAIGYRKEGGRPIATIVFEYDKPELAQMDLSARCLLAKEGTSTHFDAPIAESYFRVLNCDVQENAVVLNVAPVNDQPSLMFRMIFYRDALFAGCSS